jgi:Cytochrome P450
VNEHGDGTGMSRDEIADQLLTLLTAGHETTATTLAWAIERLRRNPEVRTLLRDFTLEPTSERGERWHSRGIAFCPAKGGRAVVRRRKQ